MIELTGLFETEFDETTQSVFNTLAAHGVEDEAIYALRDGVVQDLCRGSFRDTDDPSSSEDDPIIPVLDLILIGALIREFFPREKPDGTVVMGFKHDDWGMHALESAIETARHYGAKKEQVDECAHEVWKMFGEVRRQPDPSPAKSVLILNLMLTAMVTHRLVPRELGE